MTHKKLSFKTSCSKKIKKFRTYEIFLNKKYLSKSVTRNEHFKVPPQTIDSDGSRCYLRLDVLQQFKTDLVRQLEGLVLEEKKFLT
jgi:hypothetical protein